MSQLAERSASARRRERAGAVTEPLPSAIFTKRSTRIGLLALVLSSLTIFTATCARTVTGEDSGELIAAAHTLGVAHPPGYPTWCVLGKLASLIPVGEIAFRVALVSALFGALTIGALAAIVLLLTRSWPAAVASSLGFGLLRDQWSQATIAEVYTLNTFFLAVCILWLLLWNERLSWRFFYAFAFTYGLSLTNHPTMLGAAPPFLLFLFIRGFRLLKVWRRILVATACFLAGLLPYAYLPIAAGRSPEINWGNPVTLRGVVDHVMRRQYSEGAPVLPEQTFARCVEQLGVLWDAASSQGSVPLLVIGLLSSIWLLRRRFSLGLLLLGLAFTSTVFLVLYINVQTDFENAYASRLFFVPGYLALAIAGGWGLGEILGRLPCRLGFVAAVVACLGAVAPALITNWKECDYSNYRIVAAHGRRLLMSVPQNAVLFPSSDHNTFPLLYLRFVEGLRPDVTIGDKYGYIDPPIADAAPFAKDQPSKLVRTKEFRVAIEGWIIETWNRPVFFSSKGRIQDAAKWELVSEGLWYRARRRDFPVEDRRAADEAAWGAVEATALSEEPSPYDYSAKMVLSDLCFARARSLIAKGDVQGAIENASKASRHVPRSKEIQNNLGSLLAESGQHEVGRTFFQRSVELDPKYLTGVRNLAISYHATGMRSEGRAWFQRVIELEPLDPVANRGMAQIARAEESWAEAAFYLKEVGKIDGDPRAFRDAGLITLYELREPEEAKKLLRASLSIDPKQPEIAEVEQNIKKKGGGDEESAGKKGKDGGEKTEVDERERHARESALKLFGEDGPKPPTAPDPLSRLMPKTNVPTAPSLPNDPANEKAPPSPRPPSPKPGGSR